jgi:protease I
MRNDSLEGLRVAVLAADGFEQVELTSPVEDLEDRGAEVDIISIHPGRIRGVNGMYPGKKVKVSYTLDEIGVEDYDALLIPGGLANPDTLRQNERVLDFVSAFNSQGKPIAAICHAPWVLISAGMVSGRRLTSWPGIKHDVLNAGGLWTDEPVVRDRNWVSSRGPHDLPVFNQAVAELFAEHVPLHPVEEDDRGTLGMVVAGVAAAAAGYAAWRYLQARADRYEEAPETREFTSAAPAPTRAAAPAPLPDVTQMPPSAPMPPVVPMRPAAAPTGEVEIERVVIVGDAVDR